MLTAHAHPSILVSYRVLDRTCGSRSVEDGVRVMRFRGGRNLVQLGSTSTFKGVSLRSSRWGRSRVRATADSGGVAESDLTSTSDVRKEVFEVAAENILEEDVLKQNGGSENGSSDNGSIDNGVSKGAEGKEKDKKKSKEQEVDWENVPTMPDELDLKQRHPLDPHKPNFSEVLPEPLRPYPSFEGWFVRIWDPQQNFSAAVILATNYATDESQVTLLFAPGKEVKREGGRDSVQYGYTYALAAKTKDAKFTTKEHDEEWDDNRGEEPEGFEWEANGIGRISVTPHVTDLDFTVEGYRFKAHLTKELLWDAHKSEKGPEGWARFVTIIPTHWYVYSLGSSVEYSFSNPEEKIHSEGSGFGHVEKNWGQTFPAGHVWTQAFSADNTAQVCCSGAYFKTPGEKLSTPYIFVLGYRSPKLQLDFRTNDLGIVFKDINLAARESRFSVTAVGPSHTVEIMAYAPYETFSDPVLAPVTKTDWEPACRESYVATAEVKVYEHLAWGIPGTEKLVETQKFEFAALEFGEDLLKEGSEDEGNQN
ncbi:hypothetical protein M758_10G087700 [Ceratodon purpureus]|nr:hypothetical protein M758_10G087700 [Ceratodon purpureus]